MISSRICRFSRPRRVLKEWAEKNLAAKGLFTADGYDIRIVQLQACMSRDRNIERFLADRKKFESALLAAGAPYSLVQGIEYLTQSGPEDFPFLLAGTMDALYRQGTLHLFLSEMLRTGASPKLKDEFASHLRALGLHWDRKTKQITVTGEPSPLTQEKTLSLPLTPIVTENMKDRRYDVALSFAGEDRDHAERLAVCLRRNGVRVFYDRYEQADLWGKDLYEHLAWVYKDAARYCVIFVSGNYAEKLWTTHERKSAQARAFAEKREYILPLRLDDTEIPGLPQTVGYIDLRNTSADEVCRLVREKLQKSTGPDLRGYQRIEEQPKSKGDRAEPEGPESDINHLLERLHSRGVPLSHCFVEALKIALRAGDHELEAFCKHELNGWNQIELVKFRKESASYRDLEVFLSVDQVNSRYIGWRSGQGIMNFMMRNRDKFTLTKLAMSHPISEIESFLPSDRDRDDLATMRIPLTDIASKSGIPESVDTNRSFVFAYTTTSSIRGLLESIRVELSRRLLELVH